MSQPFGNIENENFENETVRIPKKRSVRRDTRRGKEVYTFYLNIFWKKCKGGVEKKQNC